MELPPPCCRMEGSCQTPPVESPSPSWRVEGSHRTLSTELPPPCWRVEWSPGTLPTELPPPCWRVEGSHGTLPTELPHLAEGLRSLLGHFLQSCHTLLEGGGVSWDPSYGFTEMSSCMGMARTSLCKILCISDIITTVAGSQTLSFICQVYWRTW